MSDGPEVIEQGYYEAAVGDLTIDLAEALGRMLDELLGERRPEIEQIVLGVVYRDDDGEGTAWKPLHGNRWTTALALARAIVVSLENGIQ